MTKEKREYEVKDFGRHFRKKKTLVSCTTVLRRKKDSVKYAALIYQIGRLEKQYESLSFREWHRGN